MESKTVEQDQEREQELSKTKPEPRTVETRVLPPRPRKSSRKFIILIVFLLLAAAGVYLWVHSLNRVSTDDAQVDGHIIPVSSKIYGKIGEVLIDDNQQVKQGQVLVRIDPAGLSGEGGSGAGRARRRRKASRKARTPACRSRAKPPPAMYPAPKRN